MKILRDGHEKDLTVTIGEQPVTTKIAKAEGDEKEYAFAGVAVQDLDRDTAKELGLKGKTQGVVVTSSRTGQRRRQSRADAGRRDPRDQPAAGEVGEGVRKGLVGVKKGEHVLILINRRGASLFLSAKV